MIPFRDLRVLFLATALAVHAATGRTFNVREDGATSDGRTLCTTALQRTIDRCAAAGGGTVFFPAGVYLSGTLELKNNVMLELDGGATLLGSTNPKDYPVRQPVVASYTDNYVRQALIAGENLRNVGLRGRGTIDGNGGAFRWKEYRDRPYVIRLVQCQDVLVEGITLRASPMWMQHYLACDRVRIRGITVFNHVSYNNDGIDIDGCHDVTISDSVFDSDDDGLCLKSTLNRACENVTITNCVLSSHCNAFKLGTESNGGFRNITLNNCVIISPRFSQSVYGMQRGMGGIALETVDGGTLENVAISNVTIAGVNVPLFLRLGNRARPFTADGPKPGIGSLRSVTISNLVATGAGRVGCSITGLPDHRVENVTLSNLSLEFEGGGKRELVEKPVPERPEAYPESRMFGELPAYGLYCRHVDGLKISDVRMTVRAADQRHAIVCDDVADVGIVGLNVVAAGGAPAVLRLTNVTDAAVRDTRIRGAAGVFMKVDGEATRRVILAGNHFSRVDQLIDRGAGVPADAVFETNNAVLK
ncbi:MAG: glycosyl hydrolase family 28-related protein [Opitutaceae bacterium]|nr:glycosyl hydrolase family 28-related protein [Opitutaceae bacterium]